MRSWNRWFAWYPVYIVDRWYWLQHVERDQWSNRPSRYRYARYVTSEPNKAA